jgi:hypothetical protein
MPTGDAHGHRAESSEGPVEDALGRLEERLDRASQAAERLLADAAQRVTTGRGGDGSVPGETADAAQDGPGESAGTGKPPPAGWQGPGPESGRGLLDGADADLLLGLVAVLRDRIPPDLQQRLAEAIREVLLALRALIDWYLERLERRREGSVEVQDIPIL